MPYISYVLSCIFVLLSLLQFECFLHICNTVQQTCVGYVSSAVKFTDLAHNLLHCSVSGLSSDSFFIVFNPDEIRNCLKNCAWLLQYLDFFWVYFSSLGFFPSSSFFIIFFAYLSFPEFQGTSLLMKLWRDNLRLWIMISLFREDFVLFQAGI